MGGHRLAGTARHMAVRPLCVVARWYRGVWRDIVALCATRQG